MFLLCYFKEIFWKRGLKGFKFSKSFCFLFFSFISYVFVVIWQCGNFTFISTHWKKQKVRSRRSTFHFRQESLFFFSPIHSFMGDMVFPSKNLFSNFHLKQAKEWIGNLGCYWTFYCYPNLTHPKRTEWAPQCVLSSPNTFGVSLFLRPFFESCELDKKGRGGSNFWTFYCFPSLMT